MRENNITASYVNEDGEEIKISTSELNIHLDNDQILTIANSRRQSGNGISISDHSANDEKRRTYSVLQVTPCACNVIELTSIKELYKHSE
ncbi:hypothetical protein [Vibrio panuliri]|uniref:Uncharacterized protein n=1 Tax=Vibrio panuliri TaxID=1381081 RepID=A0ABX3FC92_9VIBR|nr:hypothetical protein [Vibrio panuliri]KAB1458332.1 hypothetical protein F7O85_11570 [Vibrio panuliri]OLQ86758.1 hypothetical protein BIY20_02380 [Vibrio panuliri]